jgi:transcription elongation factor Elf1
MIEINWKQDYHGEFVCPDCGRLGMSAGDNHKNKRQFYCRGCRKRQIESCNVDEIKILEDPLNPGIYWYTSHRIQGFICPNCNKENIYLIGIDKFKKKVTKS